MGVDWIWLYDVIETQDMVGDHVGVDWIRLSDVAGTQHMTGGHVLGLP